MDYEFLRDITGVVKVRMSMGHEVVGHWFNEEVKENLALLDEVEQAARAVKGSERSWQRAGHEYTLWLDGEEVMVRANQLEFSGDEMEGDELLRRRKFFTLWCRGLSSGCGGIPRICATALIHAEPAGSAMSVTSRTPAGLKNHAPVLCISLPWGCRYR